MATFKYIWICSFEISANKSKRRIRLTEPWMEGTCFDGDYVWPGFFLVHSCHQTIVTFSCENEYELVTVENIFPQVFTGRLLSKRMVLIDFWLEYSFLHTKTVNQASIHVDPLESSYTNKNDKIVIYYLVSGIKLGNVRIRTIFVKCMYILRAAKKTNCGIGLTNL